jgi:hypothetical protein
MEIMKQQRALGPHLRKKIPAPSVPVLSSLLGLLIVLFGMNRAWRASKGDQATITGPHRVGPEGAD